MFGRLKEVNWDFVGLVTMFVMLCAGGFGLMGYSILLELGVVDYKVDKVERRTKSAAQVCASKVDEIDTPPVDNGLYIRYGRLILENGTPTRLEYDSNKPDFLAHERVHVYQMCTDGISIDKLDSLDELHPNTNVYFLQTFITAREILLEHEAFHVQDGCSEEYNRQYKLWVDGYINDEQLGQYIRACVQEDMAK